MGRMLIIVVAALLGACAAVHYKVPRPPSYAIDNPQETELGRSFAAQLSSSSGISGFRLLRGIREIRRFSSRHGQNMDSRSATRWSAPHRDQSVRPTAQPRASSSRRFSFAVTNQAKESPIQPGQSDDRSSFSLDRHINRDEFTQAGTIDI